MKRRRWFLILGVLLALLVVTGLRCAHAGEVPGGASLQSASLEHGGRTRTYLFAAPDRALPLHSNVNVKPGPGLPVLLVLHGRFGTSEGMAKLTGLVPLAQREGFLVVFPQGVRRSWADARGHGPAAEQGVDDVAFLSALIDELVAKRGADPTRVYVAGMSNGAMMGVTLACRLGDRLAGVVSVTGNVPAALRESCAGRPVPLAFFLGDEDPLVPYSGGEVSGKGGAVLSAQDGAALFAQRAGCAAPTLEVLPDVDPEDGTRIEQQVFAGCREGAEVRLYTVKGGGHTWPGGWRYLGERFVGRVSKDLQASEEAWRFLRRFSRPAP